MTELRAPNHSMQTDSGFALAADASANDYICYSSSREPPEHGSPPSDYDTQLIVRKAIRLFFSTRVELANFRLGSLPGLPRSVLAPSAA